MNSVYFTASLMFCASLYSGGLSMATFAGGCFWCMESPFEKTEGVVEVISGYTGGTTENPTYEEVSSGSTGHYEAVRIIFDPEKVSYSQLLEIFWRQIDPTDGGGQFVDRGKQYGSAIFFHTQEQKKEAIESKDLLIKTGRFDKPIVTEIVQAGEFYPAEDYHQDYYKKNPVRYRIYRFGSGRDRFLERFWKDAPKIAIERKEGNWKNFKKPSVEELRERLSPLQFRVTQEEGTEPAFKNEYWDNKEEGIYVDVVSGEPLFISRDKFDSGTGWPSFTKPIRKDVVVEKIDRALFMTRTEVRSAISDSHLGHVFNDGPPPHGLRYCINSAALRFISRENMKKEGYGELLELFEEDK